MNGVHTKVRGVSEYQDVAEAVDTGDFLVLRRESDNEFDDNAIAIWSDQGQVGYVGARLAEDLAPEMDAGRSHYATVTEVTGGSPDKPTLGINIEINEWPTEGNAPKEWVSSQDAEEPEGGCGCFWIVLFICALWFVYLLLTQ